MTRLLIAVALATQKARLIEDACMYLIVLEVLVIAVALVAQKARLFEDELT